MLTSALLLAAQLALKFAGVESIEGTGARALALDYRMTTTSRVEVDFALIDTETKQQRIFGTDGDGAQHKTQLYVNSVGVFSFGVGDTFKSHPTGVRADTARHTAIVDNAARMLYLITGATTNYAGRITSPCACDSGYALAVFGASMSPNGKILGEFAKARIYGVSCYEAGRLVRQYHPVVENGVPGLRDALSGNIRLMSWEVPNWNVILTAPGILDPACGHVQGIAVTTDAIYYSQIGMIVKADWQGRFVKKAAQSRKGAHTGDLCASKGRLYVAVCSNGPGSYFGEENGRQMLGLIQVYDAELNLLKEKAVARPPDGITVLDGVLYLGLGKAEMYPDKPYRGNWYGKFNAETLEPLCEPFMVDHGHDSYVGIQNMTNDGEYIYANYYTVVEAERTPNFVKYDRNMNVVATTRFGYAYGVDFIPGGADGTRRFMYCDTLKSPRPGTNDFESQAVFLVGEWNGRQWRPLNTRGVYMIREER